MEEGFENDKVFIVKEGEFSVYKNVMRPNLMGKEELTKSKIASITAGEIFGENCLFPTGHINHSNTHAHGHTPFCADSAITVEAMSSDCKLYIVEGKEFSRNFAKAIDKI